MEIYEGDEDMIVLVATEVLIILMLLPRCQLQMLTNRVEYSYSYIVANLRLL